PRSSMRRPTGAGGQPRLSRCHSSKQVSGKPRAVHTTPAVQPVTTRTRVRPVEVLTRRQRFLHHVLPIGDPASRAGNGLKRLLLQRNEEGAGEEPQNTRVWRISESR